MSVKQDMRLTLYYSVDDCSCSHGKYNHWFFYIYNIWNVRILNAFPTTFFSVLIIYLFIFVCFCVRVYDFFFMSVFLSVCRCLCAGWQYIKKYERYIGHFCAQTRPSFCTLQLIWLSPFAMAMDTCPCRSYFFKCIDI